MAIFSVLIPLNWRKVPLVGNLQTVFKYLYKELKIFVNMAVQSEYFSNQPRLPINKIGCTSEIKSACACIFFVIYLTKLQEKLSK